MKLRYTSIKLIVLWSSALLLTIIKLLYIVDFSWYWIIGLIILSFTTFEIGNKKYKF